MPFTWSPQRIQWYLDASKCSTFHQQLAHKIRPFLQPEDRICDMGCGLGRLSLELSPFVHHITCTDIDENVLDVIAQDIQKGPQTNLSVLHGDAHDVPEQYDVTLMAFFGGPQKLILNALEHNTKRALIHVANFHDGGTRSPLHRHYHSKGTLEDTIAMTTQAGYITELYRHHLDFSQPLKSPEEAEAFLHCSYPKLSTCEIQTLARENLVTTDSNEFPYRYPKSKDIGILVIRKPSLVFPDVTSKVLLH